MPSVTVAMALPLSANPNGMRMRRDLPRTGHPHPAIASPGPIAGKPDISRRRHGRYSFDRLSRWSLLDDHRLRRIGRDYLVWLLNDHRRGLDKKGGGGRRPGGGHHTV